MTLVKFRKPNDNASLFNTPFSGLLENFFNDRFFTNDYASFVPAINISEEKEKFNVELSAPGFDKGDFKVEVDKGILTISASHKTEKETNEKNYTRKEFNYGSFQRSFTLPEEVKEDAIEAKYENGILRLILPRIEKAQVNTTKQISIS